MKKQGFAPSREKRRIKHVFVLRHVHASTDTDEIIAELEQFDHEVIHIRSMKHSIPKTPLPLTYHDHEKKGK